MELREGLKFNHHGYLIELSYYNEDDNDNITWIDTMGNAWEPYYIIEELKHNEYQLISYPYKVGDYIKITKYQKGSAVGSIVKITVVSYDRVWYLDPITKKEFVAALDYITPAYDYEINNIKKQEKMKETKFKVGDWVKITQSDYNWGPQMNKFDGKIVQITKMLNDHTIRFEGDEGYEWNFSHGHFVKADSPTRLLSPEEQEYLLVGYATVPTTLSTPSFTITTPSVKYDTTSMKVMALDYVDFMTGSSSPTISIIKPKNKKSMFKSDIVSFK
jgi:hypothetical protein